MNVARVGTIPVVHAPADVNESFVGVVVEFVGFLIVPVGTFLRRMLVYIFRYFVL